MIACYDLARCPPTYDAVAFLALAEAERLRRGEEHIDVRILPGPVGGFRADSLWPRSVEERVALREQVLVPLCRLLPSVRSVVVEGDRRAEGWGKGEYFIGFQKIMEALRGGMRPLRGDVPDVGMQGYLTFTLREAAHHPLRNSREDEWVAAAQDLSKRGRKVLIIRDTICADEALKGAPEPILDAGLVARDLKMRAFVYSNADLNVGISNGPMWMSIFMDAPTLMLRPTTNRAGGCYDDKFYARFGLPRGGQLPTSPPHQRLVWQEDTCENIVRAVEEMLSEVARA